MRETGSSSSSPAARIVPQPVAGLIRFYSGLTPRRIRMLKQRFNPAVCGDDSFWRRRSNCRYATLIEIHGVEPIHTGPVLSPSRGVSWFVLDPSGYPQAKATRGPSPQTVSHSPCSSRSWSDLYPARAHPLDPRGARSDASPCDTFLYTLTAGAIRNRYVRAPPPKFRSRLSAPRSPRVETTPQLVGGPIVLLLPDGKRVTTEITDRKDVPVARLGAVLYTSRG